MITFVIHDPFAPRKSPRYLKTREEIREIARGLSIPRGRNTNDTVTNLIQAGVNIKALGIIS